MSGRLIVTTTVRCANVHQDSGFVYVLDLTTKDVISKLPMAESLYRTEDPNPRGGLRGARGVTVFQDRLVLANTERLMVFDRQWRLLRQFTHPWFGGIHDLHADAEGIWICCTNTDLVVKVSWDGRVIADWEWRRHESLKSAFGLPNLSPVDRTLDYRNPQTMRSGVPNIVHLNSVFPAPDGGLLLSFGRVLSAARYRRARLEGRLGRIARCLGVTRGRTDKSRMTGRPGRIPDSSSAIVWMRKDGSPEIVTHVHGLEIPNHNIWLANGGLFYNDTNNARLTIQPWRDGRPATQIAIPGSFLRGLARLDEHTFLVGSNQPAAVYRVDLRTRAVTDSIQLSSHPTEAVFSICLLPDEFADPPRKWPDAILAQESGTPN